MIVEQDPADSDLIAACGRLRAHLETTEARFAEWARRHPAADFPDAEADALDRRARLLERAVMATPARTLRGAAAKASVCFGSDSWSDSEPCSIVQSLLADLRKEAPL